MKLRNIIYLLLPTLFFVGCNQIEFDPVPLDKVLTDSDIEATYTIEELKREFMKRTDYFSGTPTNPANLYTANLIESEEDVVISGYITSTDVEGNIYKYFVLQEEGEEGMAIKVSIDANGLSSEFPIGQRVSIRCNGLHIGNYGEAVQLGSYYENPTRFKVHSDGNTYHRVEPGRMPAYLARTHIYQHGLPTINPIIPDTVTIPELQSMDPDDWTNKLVVIKDAYFTGFDDKGKALALNSLIFAPSTGGIGYPQLREITDPTGFKINIATSEYAKFALKPLPTSNYQGNITVLIGWYRNYTDQQGTWQLTLRTLGDLGEGFEGYLTEVGYTK